MNQPIERTVCDRCKDKGTAVCNDCPAGMAYDAAEARAKKVRAIESRELHSEFRKKYSRRSVRNLKSGRKRWGR